MTEKWAMGCCRLAKGGSGKGVFDRSGVFGRGGSRGGSLLGLQDNGLSWDDRISSASQCKGYTDVLPVNILFARRAVLTRISSFEDLRLLMFVCGFSVLVNTVCVGI